MINKSHHSNLDERREFYKLSLGEPPEDDNIYNYYLNMFGMAIAPYNAGFPYTIHIRQELVKIIMMIQEDISADANRQIGIRKNPKKFIKNLFKRKKK